MATHLYNETDGPIRVSDGQGNLRRFPPGSVVSVSGDLEKNASGVKGLRAATDAEVQGRSPAFGPSRDVTRDQALADLGAYARTMTVAVPLNQVIGDDEAPYGPPSGTITTKQAVMRDGTGGPHFGEGEWVPEAADERDLSVVQEAQAKASGRVEAMTDKVNALGEGDKLSVSAEEAAGSAGDPGAGGRRDAPPTTRSAKETAERQAKRATRSKAPQK